MKTVLDFLYCTITGVGAFALLVIVVGAVTSPVLGGIWILKKIAERSPGVRRFTSNILPGIILGIFFAAMISFLIIAAHDWGCDIHGHQEHRILKDKW